MEIYDTTKIKDEPALVLKLSKEKGHLCNGLLQVYFDNILEMQTYCTFFIGEEEHKMSIASVGISILNSNDVWDYDIGRKVAFQKAVNDFIAPLGFWLSDEQVAFNKKYLWDKFLKWCI